MDVPKQDIYTQFMAIKCYQIIRRLIFETIWFWGTLFSANLDRTAPFSIMRRIEDGWELDHLHGEQTISHERKTAPWYSFFDPCPCNQQRNLGLPCVFFHLSLFSRQRDNNLRLNQQTRIEPEVSAETSIYIYSMYIYISTTTVQYMIRLKQNISVMT
jgi:hypothetical protein